MSTEIRYETDHQMAEGALLDLVVSRLGADVVRPPDGSPAFGEAPGMSFWCYALPDHDDDPDDEDKEQFHAAHMGFRRRSLIIFQIDGTADLDAQDMAWAQILTLSADLAHQYRGEAALLLNGEQILMRATASTGAVFDSWEGFAEVPQLAETVARWPQHPLDQPWL